MGMDLVLRWAEPGPGKDLTPVPGLSPGPGSGSGSGIEPKALQPSILYPHRVRVPGTAHTVVLV